MFIPPEHIVPELRATEHTAAIRELLQHLVHVGTIPSGEVASMFAAFLRREETMTTGVGFGYAYPHISSAAVTEQVLALGRSQQGIHFNSLDGQPAKVIVLMISPGVQPGT